MTHRRLPQQDFFYQFEDLGESPDPEHILRDVPKGLRRQHAFFHFMTRFPDEIRYVFHYLQSRNENTLYEDEDYEECYQVIERGLSLNDVDGIHEQLKKTASTLKRQQQAMWDECGNDPPDPSSPYILFQTGQYDPLIARHQELESTVKPRGILGPKTEREYWNLCEWRMRIEFVEDRPDKALARLDTYETGRISVKLSPIPQFDIQEAAIGYQVERDLPAVEKRLQRWLTESKNPVISDLICYHPKFVTFFA